MKKRVMLIQDNEECTEIMRLILEEEGIEVFSSGANQEYNNSQNCDLLIIDEFSKGKTGCELCKQLKSGSNRFNKPIVLTSTGVGLETFSADCNADIYLSKPFDIDYFARLVKSLLEQQSPVYYGAK
jgi:two-component system phosphate regulon response regulator PhoB